MISDNIRTIILANPELQALAHASNIDAIVSYINANHTLKYSDSKTIGVGTILAKITNGGVFLNTLKTIGDSNPDVYWSFVLIERSAFDIGWPETRAKMLGLAQAIPTIATQIQQLIALAKEPISETDVKMAIFADNGDLLV